LNCAEAAPVSLREAVRKLRHAAYTTGDWNNWAGSLMLIILLSGGRVKLKQLLRRYVELKEKKLKRNAGGRTYQAACRCWTANVCLLPVAGIACCHRRTQLYTLRGCTPETDQCEPWLRLW